MSKTLKNDLRALYKMSLEHNDLEKQQIKLEHEQAKLDKAFATVERKNKALNKRVKPVITRLAKSGKTL